MNIDGPFARMIYLLHWCLYSGQGVALAIGGHSELMTTFDAEEERQQNKENGISKTDRNHHFTQFSLVE